jgi:hypothetical protein
MSTHQYSPLNPDDEDGDAPVLSQPSTTRSRGALISTWVIWLIVSLLIILAFLQFGHWIAPEHSRDELSVNDTSPIEKEPQEPEHMHGKLNVA